MAPITPKNVFVLFGFALLTFAAMGARAIAQDESKSDHFQLHSSEFENNTTLPISSISNFVVNGINVCSIDGSMGGDRSPELSWAGAPPRTRTFVLVDYDATASFTHWGMYNIPASIMELPENAGVSGSPDGQQIFNDFGLNEYDGPCPPPDIQPVVHHYVFTLYALDIELDLGSTNFPATAETLYQALIKAEQQKHILRTTTLTGLYSTTPSQ